MADVEQDAEVDVGPGGRLRIDSEDAHAPEWAATPRAPAAGLRPELPESRGYRLKRLLLGAPLTSDQLYDERLGKPTALAVLSSDVMSSCAYATESILRILLPAAGVAAFALITPITLLLLVVLGVVCLCYRQVVQAYPVSGGSYVVSRENFGYSVAQIPAAALLCSYVLTVAVSVAAGVDAVISAIPALAPYPVELSIGFVLLLTYGNLRGIREAGQVFAVPTYWFFVSMGALFIAGLVRLAVSGHLHRYSAHAAGHVPVGTAGGGLLLGVSVFIFMRAFANGGSAMTGMEAISNAVTVFKEPQVKNARATLVLMASILGVMFVGVSAMAAVTHAVPFLLGTPTVLSQLGRAVFGASPAGSVGYYSLQFSTALILILGANTSFNGFPLLVSFIAQDAYLPRPLTTRGHRLVYSNGIVLLAGVSVALLLATRANVSSLIPLYACTVFTGFTMAGAGMTQYHRKHPGPHQRRNLAINGTAFVASAVVTAIFVVTEFTRGAWLVVVAIPLIVFVLSRTHRRYRAEKEVLAEDLAVPAPAERVLRHHAVVVLVDRLDLSTARALQLAGSLTSSGDVRAVHFAVDVERAERIAAFWRQPGLMHVPLDVVECPDRRIVRAATELAADLAADGDTEVTLVLPRRAHRGVAYRLLHDQTADRIVVAVNQIPHVSATIAPFDPTGILRRRAMAEGKIGKQATSSKDDPRRSAMVEGAIPLGELTYRQRAVVAGRVRTVRVQPWSGVSVLECTIVDDSGALRIVFLGRRSIAGIEPGAVLRAEGMVGQHGGRLAMINPSYDLVAPPTSGVGHAAS
ncbi:MAG: nucleic acid binding OB-fold tRNA/helicase-type [Acidimicrobiaceae bacterium]|nr:nucleic acid binding OB-fold tRNA/helicase-type [Acidimicrobiaceae bacterium]